MATLGYTKTVKEYMEDKKKKWNVAEEHLNLLIEEYLDIQMDEYLDKCWEEYEEFQVTSWEKSDSFKHILKVELPTVEWFCDLFDYPTSTIEDWKRENSNISGTFNRLMRKQALMIQNWAISGRYNPIISKMLLNVNHGYKEVEKKEVEHSGEIKNPSWVFSALTAVRDKVVWK